MINRPKIFISKLLFLLLAPSVSQASACCGGGFALPALITSDDAAQFTASYSRAKIDTDVFSNGVWQKRTADQTTDTFKLETARIFSDRFQAGASLPFQKTLEAKDSTSQAGDATLQLGYEYLPDWDYNPWRPHGVGFLSLTAPTGKSIYETESQLSTGRGFWSLGAGSALTKAWRRWDVYCIFEAHKSFERKVDTSQLQATVTPGWGSTFSIGGGFNTKNWRWGSGLTWSTEDPISVRGSQNSDGSVQRFATATASGSYLWDSHWAGTFSYSDQTLFGDPTNASLSKSVALLIQRRWPR